MMPYKYPVGFLLLGVMTVQLLAHPQLPPLQPPSSVNEAVEAISADQLLCLLNADSDQTDPEACGHSPFENSPPSDSVPSSQGPTPPPQGPPPSPQGPPPSTQGLPPPEVLPPSPLELPPAPIGSSCTCVPVWKCNDNKLGTEVVDDPLSSIVLDLRSNTGCPAPEDVCCRNINPEGLPPVSSPITAQKCGERNFLGVGVSFLGFEQRQTQFGEFPWMSAIVSYTHESQSKPLFIGSGSLIHPLFVMTVAHKIRDRQPNQIKVRLGDWNLEKQTEPVPHTEINVAEIVIHPAYSGDPLHMYDVALLVLERPAELSPTINTVCMPVNENDYHHDKCVVTGWGKKDFHDRSRFQEILKAIPLPLVKHDTCQSALQNTRLGSHFILHDSFLCAGGEIEGQDACTGDGGSPLVCPLVDGSGYAQVGVVSWGIECGKIGRPGVYADVLKVSRWVEEVLAQKTGEPGLLNNQPLLDIRNQQK